jgi:hypothetical protein
MGGSAVVNDATIDYEFRFNDGTTISVPVRMHVSGFELLPPPQATAAHWARLDFHQCPNCPLNPRDVPHCPAALQLVSLARACAAFPSHEAVDLTVTTPERSVRQSTTLQRALGSLLGVMFAASGCPPTRFFQPMARFHLPLASEEETVYRAASMYLLAQYFRAQRGQAVDLELAGLADIYRNVQVVNERLAQRLRAATGGDAAVNAVVLLDLLAKALPYSITDSLEGLENLFAPYLHTSAGDSPDRS